MDQKDNSGIWTALATPFKEEFEEIDWKAFDKLIDLQNEAKVTGVVLCGTTGEAPVLTENERKLIIKRAKKSLDKEIKIMVGTGTNSTKQTIFLSSIALDFGADSLLIATPPYNKPSVEGLINHYYEISNSIQAPIFLYHVPGRTCQKLSANTIKTICDIEYIVGVKEASGDINFFSQAKQLAKNTPFLSGDDGTFLASLAVGGKGCISVVSNVFPKEMKLLMESYLNGNIERALAIHEAMFPFINSLFCESNPGPLKAALNIRGLCENYLRPPLAAVEPEHVNLIVKSYNYTSVALERLLS